MNASTIPARPATPAAPAPSRMTIAGISRGRLAKPRRVLAYGPEGVGKSTFGAGAPDAIFIAPEDGTAQIDVARFPEPSNWTDVLAAIALLTTGDHAFKTLVIDTLDWLEPLINAHVCLSNGWKDIEAPGYGKGPAAALDVWRAFLRDLDILRAKRGVEIVLLAHSQTRTFRNPVSDDYDRYELKMPPKAAGLVKEWVDAVLFANYETFAAKKDGRVRGVSTGARFLWTTHCAAFDAKNRFGLPEQIPLAWDDFDALSKAHAPEEIEKLRADIKDLLAAADSETRKVGMKWLNENSPTAEALAVAVNRLRAKATISAQQTETTETNPAANAA